MKDSVKYIAALIIFIAAAFVLSWCAVYSYWLAAFLFRSVSVVRIADRIGCAVLLPVRTIFEMIGHGFERMTLLTNPLLYAQVNGVLLGIAAYACCRRWIFPTEPPR